MRVILGKSSMIFLKFSKVMLPCDLVSLVRGQSLQFKLQAVVGSIVILNGPKRFIRKSGSILNIPTTKNFGDFRQIVFNALSKELIMILLEHSFKLF
jgi:hypothetical protein